jgi:membrane protein DedA with SNARE-associated domain
VGAVSSLVDEVLKLSGPAAYALVGGLAFGESALLVGFVLPGETAVLLGGVLASQHRVSLPAIATVAVAGAILGDAVSFGVGRYFGDRILKLGVFRKRTREVQRGLQAVRGHGGLAVFLARFTAFLRAVMPALAGVARMPYRRFFVFNAAGGLIWAGGLTLLGFAAGASYERVESAAGTASAGVLAVVALAALVFFVRRRRPTRKPAHDRAA